MIKYDTIKEICDKAEARGIKISELCLEDQSEQMGLSKEEIYEMMEKNFDVMVDSVEKGSDKNLRSTSGLTGGEGATMLEYSQKATGGLMGMVIAKQASIAGAEGGCQAECGSASGMAAASLVEIMGGSPRACGDALGMSLVNQMGLVCDPVAGLVEIPCVKRNVSGVVIAFSSADMALAGVELKIPVDECIAAMKSVGDSMSSALKETAMGGLAASPTGIRLRKEVFGE